MFFLQNYDAAHDIDFSSDTGTNFRMIYNFKLAL